MPGVEILNEVVVSNNPVAGIIVLVCGILISLISLVALVLAAKDGSPFVIGFLLTCALGGLFIGFGIDELNQLPETHYQVTIDDSVPMNEFYKKYEIIEVEGKIYTIKEKAPNE